MCHEATPPLLTSAAVEDRLVEIRARDGFPLRGHLATPVEGTRGPGLLLLHDFIGPSTFYRNLAIRFAERGIATLLLDFYSRYPPIDLDDRDAAWARRRQFRQQEAVADCVDAVGWFRQELRPSVVATGGFCLGGTLAMITPTEVQCEGAIVYYGFPRRRGNGSPELEPISPIDDGVFARVPTLGFWGELDDVVGIANVHDYDSMLSKEGIEHEFHILPGLGHGFLTLEPSDDAYEASTETMARTCAFLHELDGEVVTV